MNSQKGNNNAWCQDNRIGWVNWNNGKEGEELLAFVKQLIQFRKSHPVLHGAKELRLMDYLGAGCPGSLLSQPESMVFPRWKIPADLSV